MNMIIINVSLAFTDKKYALIEKKRERITFDLHRTHLTSDFFSKCFEQMG